MRFALGSSAGMVPLKALEQENGQSRLADETQAQQFPGQRAGEEVIIENPSGTLAGTGYRAAVTDLVTRLSSVESENFTSHLAGLKFRPPASGCARMVGVRDRCGPLGRDDQVAACSWKRGTDLEERSRRGCDLPDHR